MNEFAITHRRVRANGVELYCAEAGDPNDPLLVLLHGFPEFWFAWRHYMSTLAASGFHVVAPDQRGYDLSEKPRGIDAYRLDTLADDIAELAVALGHETFRVVGHDWGGSVAWSIAERHGHSLERMVVLNAPHPAIWLRAMTSDAEQRRKSAYVRFLQVPRLPEMVLRIGRYDGLGKALRTACPESFTPDVIQAYHGAWGRPDALTAMLNWYRALWRYPVAMPEPETLSPPCLIVWGDSDPFAIPKLAGESAALCAQAEVLHMPDAGHWIIHEARETVLAHLHRFLK
jgi:pimeloyl-ACP methyl ester carboxylesterase